MLLESDPADGAVLAQSPPMVVLRFDEPVTLAKVEILDSTGKPAGGAITVMAQDAELHLHIPAALAEGAISSATMSPPSIPIPWAGPSSSASARPAPVRSRAAIAPRR
jgi:Copper resistance protein CopC.